MADDEAPRQGWDGRCPNCETVVLPHGFWGLPVNKFAYRSGKCGWECQMEFDLDGTLDDEGTPTMVRT